MTNQELIEAAKALPDEPALYLYPILFGIKYGQRSRDQMSKWESDRPRFEDQSPADLIEILDDIREQLRCCQDATDFCLWVGERLNVDTRANAYEDNLEEEE